MQTEKNNSRSLEGKKVVLLGGSSGIGLATAKAAAAEGAQIIIRRKMWLLLSSI